MTKITLIESEDFRESYFDRQELIDWWDQEIITQSKIFVVGAGAIGNEVLKNLALLGFRKFFICDFDTIEITNLSRTVLFDESDLGGKKAEVAAYKTKDLILGDDVEIDWFHGDVVWDVGLGRFADYDVVLSCLDNIEARKAIAHACKKLRIPFIDAGISRLSGHVSVYPPDAKACYLCNLSALQEKSARRRYSCDDVKVSFLNEKKVPTVQVTSAVISGIQSQEVVKTLMGFNNGEAFKVIYDGARLDFDRLTLREDPRCKQTFHRGIEFEDCDVNNGHTARQALAYFREMMGQDACINLTGDREIVRSVNCRRCGKTRTLLKPAHELFDVEMYCEDRSLCGDQDALPLDVPTSKETMTVLSADESAILDYTLDDLGIPDQHIVTVVAGRIEKNFRLSRRLFENIIVGT